jgi:hypothetical protein
MSRMKNPFVADLVAIPLRYAKAAVRHKAFDSISDQRPRRGARRPFRGIHCAQNGFEVERWHLSHHSVNILVEELNAVECGATTIEFTADERGG